MPLRIVNKNSTVQDKAPLAADLQIGEIAVNANVNSPAAYIKDSAGNIVKIAGSGSVGDDWSRTGTALFPKTTGDTIQFSAGTAALPGVTPVGDTNTGIYSPGADQLALSTNGTGRLFIDSNGHVGIGVSSPLNTNYRFSVVGNRSNFAANSSALNLYLQYNSSTNGVFIGSPAADALSFSDSGGSERMRLTTTGLGIGVSAPSGLLTLGWNSSTGINAGLIGQVNNSAGANNGYRIGLRTSSGTTNWCSIDQAFTNLGVNADTYIAFTTTNGFNSTSERMRLTSTGLGIGTTSPQQALHVVNSSNTSTFADNVSFIIESVNRNAIVDIKAKSNVDSLLSFSDELGSSVGEVRYTHTDDSMRFRVNAAERARIDSSGRLLVGTSTAPTGSTAGSITATNSIFTSGNVHGQYAGDGTLTGTTGTAVFKFKITSTNNNRACFVKLSVFGRAPSTTVTNSPAAEYAFQLHMNSSNVMTLNGVTSIFEYTFVRATHFAFANLGSGEGTVTITNPVALSLSLGYKVEILNAPAAGTFYLDSVTYT